MYQDLPFIGIFGNTKELEIIEFLIAEPNDFYNISQLRDILEMHRDTVSRILTKFQEIGIVEFVERGKSKCYRLNGSSKIVRSLDLLSAGITDETGPDLGFFDATLDVMYPPEARSRKALELQGTIVSEGLLGKYVEIFLGNTLSSDKPSSQISASAVTDSSCQEFIGGVEAW